MSQWRQGSTGVEADEISGGVRESPLNGLWEPRHGILCYRVTPTQLYNHLSVKELRTAGSPIRSTQKSHQKVSYFSLWHYCMMLLLLLKALDLINIKQFATVCEVQWRDWLRPHFDTGPSPDAGCDEMTSDTDNMRHFHAFPLWFAHSVTAVWLTLLLLFHFFVLDLEVQTACCYISQAPTSESRITM